MKKNELWDILDVNGGKTGRIIERGQAMDDGEYHLAVHVWIHNRKGEWLISNRIYFMFLSSISAISRIF